MATNAESFEQQIMSAKTASEYNAVRGRISRAIAVTDHDSPDLAELYGLHELAKVAMLSAGAGS